MLGLLIRDKLNLEHFCGAPFVLSSCGHCYKEGEHPKISLFSCESCLAPLGLASHTYIIYLIYYYLIGSYWLM